MKAPAPAETMQPDTEQMAAARKLVELLAKLPEQLPADFKRNYVQGLLAADVNHDGVISSAELAQSVMAADGMFASIPNTKKIWAANCVQGNPAMVESQAMLVGYNAQRTLDVLNNPQTGPGSNAEMAQMAAMRTYSILTGLDADEIAPTTRQFIEDAARQLLRTNDLATLKMYDALKQEHAIGALPRQVEPLGAAELCRAAKGNSI